MASLVPSNYSSGIYTVSVSTNNENSTYTFVRSNDYTETKIMTPFDIFRIDECNFPVTVDIEAHALLELDEFSIMKMKRKSY
jgi:hypothetical protein